MLKKVIGLIFVFSFFSTSLLAQITKVELYPRGAKIFVSLEVQNKQTTFYLPISANPNSLIFYGHKHLFVKNFSYKKIKKDIPLIKQLKLKIKNLEIQKQKLQPTYKALETVLKFWHSQAKKNDLSLKNIARFSQIIFTQTKNVQTKINKIKVKIHSLEEQIKNLKEQIEEITSNSKEVWVINLICQGKGRLVYSYFDEQAGWKSNYSLFAFPKQGTVNFLWQASIWQKTGQNWQNIPVILVSGYFSRQLTPPNLPDWKISPIQPAPLTKTMNFSKNLARAPLISKRSKDLLPLKKTGDFFDQYALHNINLSSGQNQNFIILQKTLKAKFAYLIRPYRSTKAFLWAKVQFNLAQRIPNGLASLFVDNTFIGKKLFKVWTDTLNLYLGSDPQIKTSFYAYKQQDKKGLFENKKVILYTYKVSVKNLKTQKVQIRIEDAKPKAGDKRIKIQANYSIQPKEKYNKIFWDLTLKPQEEKIITYTYKIIFPEKLKLNMER
ncbi:MAG: DUF4139 domain-containing protein [Desulfonauticus sp.]|nr:DUF4139 domain-containing protein [Desulfonauticus sp.]